MNNGITLQALATEVKRQAESAEDVVATTTSTRVECEEPDEPILHIYQNHETAMFGDVVHSFPLSIHAGEQLASRIGIPRSYWRKLRSEYPALLETNANVLMTSEPQNMMVRALDGRARAVVSNRFGRYDNWALMEHMLPVFGEPQMPDVEFPSCYVDAERMYIKVVSPRLEGEVKRGDPVQVGVVISNSEVGLGTLSIQAFVHRLVCTNGMIMPEHLGGITRRHVGSVLSRTGQDSRLLAAAMSDATLAQESKTLFMAGADVVRHVLTQDTMEKILGLLRAATEDRIDGHPVGAVRVLAKTFKLDDAESLSVLNHLIAGGDLSRYGMMNAVTATAHTMATDSIPMPSDWGSPAPVLTPSPSYHRSTELEEIGGRVLQMPARQWRTIANAEAPKIG